MCEFNIFATDATFSSFLSFRNHSLFWTYIQYTVRKDAIFGFHSALTRRSAIEIIWNFFEVSIQIEFYLSVSHSVEIQYYYVFIKKLSIMTIIFRF